MFCLSFREVRRTVSTILRIANIRALRLDSAAYAELSFQADHLTALQLISTALVAVSAHTAGSLRYATDPGVRPADFNVHHVDMEANIDKLPEEVQVGAPPRLR